MSKGSTRCTWCGDDPLYVRYHDDEWGVPVHDERTLFEFMVLEGAQAGLAWITILRKRAGYAKAFADFDPERVARFGAADTARLMADANIVRNRLKISSTIDNAKRVLEVRASHGSLSQLLWSFAGGRPIQNQWRSTGELPAETAESKAMSKGLKRLGFRFVGPTICYSLMQATGMVNDHLVGCFRHREVRDLKAPGTRRSSSRRPTTTS